MYFDEKVEKLPVLMKSLNIFSVKLYRSNSVHYATCRLSAETLQCCLSVIALYKGILFIFLNFSNFGKRLQNREVDLNGFVLILAFTPTRVSV